MLDTPPAERLHKAAQAARVVQERQDAGDLTPEQANTLWHSIDVYREDVMAQMRHR